MMMSQAQRDNIIMAIAASGDTKHDFKELLTGTPTPQFISDYRLGLPTSGATDAELFLNEDNVFNNIVPVGNNFVIDSKTPIPAGLVGFKLGKEKNKADYYTNVQTLINYHFNVLNGQQGQPPTNSLNISTINGKNYLITQAVVIAKRQDLIGRILDDKYEYKPPYETLQKLGIETKSAFVVDFAVPSLPDFLTTDDPTAVSDRTKSALELYFITNPETVNDAAFKTSETSKFYRNITQTSGNNNKVHMYSINQDASSAHGATYTWKPPSISPYDLFFTANKFVLSDLIEERTKKTLKIKTNITITGPSGVFSETITDSGNSSTISSVIDAILKRIKNIFSSTSKKADDNFFVNAKLQHKRTGDWLQALSCLDLKNRTYKQFRDKNASDSLVYTPTFEDKNIYFVTHDRIALGFALFLGINAIYTHAATSAYYVFRNTENLGTLEEIAEKRAKALEAEFDDKSSKIRAIILNTQIDEENYRKVGNKIDVYNAKVGDGKRGFKNNIAAAVAAAVADGITSANFKQIFILLHQYVLFLNNYQEIESPVQLVQKYDKYVTLITELNTKGLLTPLTTSVEAQMRVDQYKICIDAYQAYSNEYETIKSKVEKPVVDMSDDAYKAIMAMWDLDKLYSKNGLFDITRRDTLEDCTKKLNKVKYTKQNPNPFAVIWTPALERLPLSIKLSIYEFLKYQYGILMSNNPFLVDTTNPDIKELKKQFTVWHKLLTELIIKFESTTEQMAQPMAQPDDVPMADVPMAGLAMASVGMAGGLKPINNMQSYYPIMDSNPLSIVKNISISNKGSKKGSKSRSKTKKISRSKSKSKSKKLNYVPLNTANMLINPIKPTTIESSPFQLNAANVINEYMTYLTENDYYKTNSLTRKYSRRSLPVGGGKSKRNRKNSSPVARAASARPYTLVKPLAPLNKPSSMTLRHRNYFLEMKNQISIHKLFTEHTYFELNYVLLSDKLTMHPLLPLFMITEALSVIIHNDLSYDIELYWAYYKFIDDLRVYIFKTLPKIDYPMFAIFLRKLFFTRTDEASAHIPYTPWYTITKSLSKYISGTIYVYTYQDIFTSDDIDSIKKFILPYLKGIVPLSNDDLTNVEFRDQITELHRNIFRLKKNIDDQITKI